MLHTANKLVRKVRKLKLFIKGSDRNELYIKYKIFNSYENFEKTGKLVIQARKGGAYTRLTPKQINCDKDIMCGLHPIDAAIVSSLSIGFSQKQLEIQKNYPYRLIKREYQNAETVFIFEESSTGKLKEFTQSELEGRADFLSKLIGEESALIAFDLGVKHYFKINSLKSLIS